MTVNVCTRSAAHRLIAVHRLGSQPGREARHLKQWLQAVSTSTTGPPSHQRGTPFCKASRSPPVTARSFTTSSCLQKKGQKNAPPAATKDDSASAEDPYDFAVLEKEITTAHERLKEALGKLRSGGRFNPEVLERLRVQPDKANNAKVALSDVAQVIPKGRVVQIIVGEKEHVKQVSSAITSSDLSLTPQPDPTGNNPLLLEIKIPPPTAESRQNAVKDAAKSGDKAGVAIRDARAKQHKKHRAMQSIRSITPDTLRKAGTEMEKIVEQAHAEVKKVVDNAKKMLESV